MNLSTKLLKYLEGSRLFELLKDDERAIFSLFGLSFDATSDAVLEQQEEFKRDLLMGIIQELLDYDVDEMSNPHNYTGTGKLQYEMYRFGDKRIIDVLIEQFGEEKLYGTFRDLYDNHILVKIKKMAENSRENVEQLHDAAPEIYENNFPNFMKRFDWRELEAEYEKDKKRHNVTMEWLQEKQERELQKVLELDIMHHADEPSVQAIEDSDFQYHQSFLSHKFEPSVDYKEAYTKFMYYATRKEGLIIPKLGEYGQYIATYINKFRPEQKEALFGIIKKLELIHKDMVMFNPELAQYLNKSVVVSLEDTEYYAPSRIVLELLHRSWFESFRTNKDYTFNWCENFIRDLFNSKMKDLIVSEWKYKSKRLGIQACIIGGLKEAGVLEGSDLSIASAIVGGNDKDANTFARYMGRGREKPYFEWIVNYVKQEK